MELRESSTSEAVSRCCGSRTSSFRIKHTVFSETRPSLAETAPGEPGVGTALLGMDTPGSTTRSYHCSEPASPSHKPSQPCSCLLVLSAVL